MQDDEARDYWERHAMRTGEPNWERWPDGVTRDSTGRHDDWLPDGTRRPHTEYKPDHWISPETRTKLES